MRVFQLRAAAGQNGSAKHFSTLHQKMAIVMVTVDMPISSSKWQHIFKEMSRGATTTQERRILSEIGCHEVVHDLKTPKRDDFLVAPA